MLRWRAPLKVIAALCTGASIAAGPVLAVSILAPDYQQSFAALLVGFALSECWRAPSAIMVRHPSDISLSLMYFSACMSFSGAE